ncbi:MAG TPA: hypothetical protein VD838_23285, partial [Anaeromyxobacteraceae bacterium]|nr:hypothetical protein [Anaeromyxobacteraceae bacterium]
MHVRSVSTAAIPSLDADPPAAAVRAPPLPDPRDRIDAPLASAAASAATVSRSTRTDPLTLAGLAALVEDARIAALAPEGAPDAVTFASLRKRLEAASANLPPSYRAAVAEPLLRTLERLGPSGLARLLEEDPGREGPAGLLLDVAHAVLQRGEGL